MIKQADVKKLAEFVWGKDNVKLLWGCRDDETWDFEPVPPEREKEEYHTEQAICFLHPEEANWQEVPDFDDLNDCFEWIVPKLSAYVLQSFHSGHKYHHATVTTDEMDLKTMRTYSADVPRTENPALAIRKAVLQLLEG